MHIKRLLTRILTKIVDLFGNNNPLFIRLLERQKDRKISLFYKRTAFEKYEIFLKRLIALRAQFPQPIVRRVTYTNNGRELFTIGLDLTDYTQSRYYFQFPDPPLRDLILTGGGTFIDIGANVGIFTLLAATCFEKVYCFEALPPIYDILAANCKPFSNIQISPCALSSREGTSQIHRNAMASGASSLNRKQPDTGAQSKKGPWQTFEIPIKRADALFDKVNLVDLIKIDVEGHEVDVLKGAYHLIQRTKPILFVECHDDEQFRQICAALPPGFLIFDPGKK